MNHPTKPATSLLRRYPWRIGLALLATGVGAAIALRWWAGPSIAAEPVLRRDFVQTIVGSGHVEAPHRVDVGAQVTGTVSRIPVAEGQTVKAGDLLVELDAAELCTAVRQADTAARQAEARLRQLREVQTPVAEQALRQAQVNLDNAKSQRRRSQELFHKGFIGEAALEDARKATYLAQAQLRSMRPCARAGATMRCRPARPADRRHADGTR
jgi:HlyD family secretion protein